MNNIKIYTDGAYSSARDKGGIGIVILQNDICIKQYSNSFFHVTNNKMELIAVIVGLRIVAKLKDINSIIVYSDSQYVINTINCNWKRKKNIKLWEKLDIELCNIKKICKSIEFNWIKGHAGNHYNEVCDFLASEETKVE